MFQPGQVNDDNARLAVLACRAAGALGRWGDAAHWAQEGQAVVPPGAKELRGWLSFVLGTAVLYIGDPLRAERELREFLHLAETESALQPFQPDAIFNLAFAMMFQNRQADEIACLEAAADSYHQRGRLSRTLVCKVEIAWSYLIAGQPTAAAPVMEEITRSLADQGDAEVEIDATLVRALYHQAVGEVDQSNELCLALLNQTNLLDRQSADAAWILGQNALAQQDFHAAVRYAQKAYSHAIKDEWAPQLERVDALLSSVAPNQMGR